MDVNRSAAVGGVRAHPQMNLLIYSGGAGLVGSVADDSAHMCHLAVSTKAPEM